MINSYLSRQITQNFPYDPTEDQVLALNLLSNFLLSEESDSLLLLKGYAGTGKTSLVGVVQASVGFRDTGALRFDAFGGLVPSCEKKDVLGILFPSACFTGRAPEEGALFSFFIGGVKHADLTTWPEEELKALIRRELHTMLKFPEETEPDMIRIFRHEHAIPQYEQSSGSRFETIDELQARYPGLTLAGNIKGGIGMADRIRQATEIADKLING